MKIDRKIAVFIAALVMIPLAAVGLSGCVPSSSTTPATGGTANSTTEPSRPSESATPTVAPSSAITNGAVLTAAQASDIQNGTSTSGMIAYQATNGQFLAVNPNQPVPAPVMQDIQVRVNAVPAPAGVTPQDSATSDGYALDLHKLIQLGTGKSTVSITYGSYVPFGGSTVRGYLAMGTRDSNGAAYVSTSLASIEAEAKAYVAKQADPSSWIIVVQQR